MLCRKLRLRKDGYGYLKTNFPKFNQVAANVMPVFLLTDLDKANCVVDFIADWRKGLDMSEQLLFRVAVREVEAWLLADRRAFADWLGISVDIIPTKPECLDDPKRELMKLARTDKVCARILESFNRSDISSKPCPRTQKN